MKYVKPQQSSSQSQLLLISIINIFQKMDTDEKMRVKKNNVRRINLSLPLCKRKRKNRENSMSKQGKKNCMTEKQETNHSVLVTTPSIPKKSFHTKSKTQGASIIHSMFPKIKNDYCDFIQAFKLFHKRRRSHQVLLERYSNRFNREAAYGDFEKLLESNTKSISNVKLCHFQIKQYLDELCQLKRSQPLKVKSEPAEEIQLIKKIPKKVDLNFNGKQAKRTPVTIRKAQLNDAEHKQRFASIPLRISGMYKNQENQQMKNPTQPISNLSKIQNRLALIVPGNSYITGVTLQITNKGPKDHQQGKQLEKSLHLKRKYKLYKDFPTSILKIKKEKGYERLSPWESFGSNFIQIET